MWLGRRWYQVIPQNFDTVGNAMQTMYEVATLEAWLAVSAAMANCVGEDMQPIEGHRPEQQLFCISIILLCSFCLMNLFVGIVIDNFNRLKFLTEGQSVLLTDTHKQWLNLQRMMLSHAPGASEGWQLREKGSVVVMLHRLSAPDYFSKNQDPNSVAPEALPYERPAPDSAALPTAG